MTYSITLLILFICSINGFELYPVNVFVGNNTIENVIPAGDRTLVYVKSNDDYGKYELYSIVEPESEIDAPELSNVNVTDDSDFNEKAVLKLDFAQLPSHSLTARIAYVESLNRVLVLAANDNGWGNITEHFLRSYTNDFSEFETLIEFPEESPKYYNGLVFNKAKSQVVAHVGQNAYRITLATMKIERIAVSCEGYDTSGTGFVAYPVFENDFVIKHVCYNQDRPNFSIYYEFVNYLGSGKEAKLQSLDIDLKDRLRSRDSPNPKKAFIEFIQKGETYEIYAATSAQKLCRLKKEDKNDIPKSECIDPYTPEEGDSKGYELPLINTSYGNGDQVLLGVFAGVFATDIERWDSLANTPYVSIQENTRYRLVENLVAWPKHGAIFYGINVEPNNVYSRFYEISTGKSLNKARDLNSIFIPTIIENNEIAVFGDSLSNVQFTNGCNVVKTIDLKYQGEFVGDYYYWEKSISDDDRKAAYYDEKSRKTYIMRDQVLYVAKDVSSLFTEKELSSDCSLTDTQKFTTNKNNVIIILGIVFGVLLTCIGTYYYYNGRKGLVEDSPANISGFEVKDEL